MNTYNSLARSCSVHFNLGKNCQKLDSNPSPLEQEVTAMPSMPWPVRFYDCKVLTIAFLKRDSINNVQIKMVAWQSYLLWVRNLARPLSHSHLHTFSPIHILSHSHLYTFPLCPIYTHSLLYTFFVPLTYTYSLFLTYTHSVYLWIIHIFIPITYTLFPSNLLKHIFHQTYLYTFSIPLTYTHFPSLSLIHIFFCLNHTHSLLYTFFVPLTCTY